MLTQITSALIVVSVTVMALFLVRYAIREGEGKDPRWGLTGRPQAGSPICEMGPKLFAIPTWRGLLLRSSSHREAEWERLYEWPTVHVDEIGGALRLGGPFGVIICDARDDMSVQDCINRMGPSAAQIA